MRFIYAFGTTQDFIYHGSTRGTVQFSTVHGIGGVPGEFCPLEDGTIVIESLITDSERWELPAYRDVYMCRLYDFPNDRRYHMVQLEAVTFNIYPATYHHAIIYDCPLGVTEGQREEWSTIRPCISAGGISGCRRFWTGWAAGQMPWCSAATAVGQAVGQGDLTVVTGLLETHIDNPYSTAGLYDDGWGLRMWLTPDLYGYADQLVFGFYLGFPQGGIPPLRDSFVMASAWGGGCTTGMPEGGIYITSITPHMHGLAHRTQVLLIPASNPNTTIVLYNQNTWDFNWQGPRMLPWDESLEGYNMLPGDTMIFSCDFDTSNKSTPTFFGEGYEDEMCIAFISWRAATTAYPLTMVFSGSTEQLAPGEYVNTRFAGGCNAPDFSYVVDISEMTPPLPDASQCGVMEEREGGFNIKRSFTLPKKT
eukprot:c9125_g1_i1.p1 GENE.c9125_g1_i1~~c9125_g1_i1.p1  ORF type:complete len:421 (-),score=15.91 c9125_g1_i1:46-1308(-)